jgi:hypothetical protein
VRLSVEYKLRSTGMSDERTKLPNELQLKINPKISEFGKLCEEDGSLDQRRLTLLCELLGEFSKYDKPPSWKADVELAKYVSEKFELRQSRVYEYVRVANKKAVRELNLSISKLCMLAAFEENEIKKFLKQNPESELKKVSCRKLAELLESIETKKNKSKKNNGSDDPVSLEVVGKLSSGDLKENIIRCCDELLGLLNQVDRRSSLAPEIASKLYEIYSFKIDSKTPSMKKAA